LGGLGDVKCLSALPHQSFYTLPNWIEYIVLCVLLTAVFGPRFYPTCNLLSWVCWIGQVVVLVVWAEVVLTSIVAFPHTYHTLSSAEHTMFSRAAVSLLAAFPVMIQDIARLQSKIYRGKFHHVFLQFDWMDGQREHIPSTIFATRFKVCVFLLLTNLTSFGGEQSSWLISIYVLMLVAAGIMWYQGQYYSLEMEAVESIARLPPVPIDFTGSPGAPFVVLAWQRTGSNLLCGKLHNHFQVVMHNEIFNDAKIWTYQNEDIRSDPSWKWDVFSRDLDPIAFLKDLCLREPLKQKMS
jgi:hypothetical protein